MTTATAPVDEKTIDELLRELDDAPEAPCEARPTHHGPKPCSHEVTHRLHACQRTILVCSVAVERLERAMAQGARCSKHGHPIASAWKLIPA